MHYILKVYLSLATFFILEDQEPWDIIVSQSGLWEGVDSAVYEVDTSLGFYMGERNST